MGAAQLGATIALGLACGARAHATAGATQVSAADEYTCALLSNHKVKCWGAGFWDQLGDGRTTSSSTPVPVSGITNANAVSAGDLYACSLLSNHGVKC